MLATATGDTERVVMVREARLSAPPGFLVPDFAAGLADASVDEREVRCRNTTYFDTASLRLADLGITARRDHSVRGYDWTLVVTSDPGAPFPIRRRVRYGERSQAVPSALARYLRNHHRPAGIRPQAIVSGRAEVLPLRMRGVHLRVGEVVDESLVARSISERVRTLRQITVVAFDLDGVGRRVLEAATAELVNAGCCLELVSGDLFRFVDPPSISAAAG